MRMRKFKALMEDGPLPDLGEDDFNENEKDDDKEKDDSGFAIAKMSSVRKLNEIAYGPSPYGDGE